LPAGPNGANPVNLKHLRTFVVVAEHGSVTRGAQTLRLTQPAASRQIEDFERTLGFELFERSGRRLHLTARGERMLKDCRGLLSHVNVLSEKARALRQSETEALRIVASSEPIEGVFPSFLHRFAGQFPGARLTLLEADQSEHLSMLQCGAVHLAATVVNVVEPDDECFATYLLPQFQVLAAAAPSLGLKRTDMVDIRQLGEYPLLLPKSSFVTRVLFDAACRLGGVQPCALVESASSHALLALANAGHGIAIFPSIVRADGTALQVMQVVQRREPLSIAPAIVWAKQRPLPRYAEAFCELFASHVTDVFPDARREDPKGKHASK
jgi:DNA-binding transcriptional LysR family regulator